MNSYVGMTMVKKEQGQGMTMVKKEQGQDD